MAHRREPHFGAGEAPQAPSRASASHDRPARPAPAPRPRRGVNLVVVLAAVTAMAGSGYYALEQQRMRSELAAQLESARQASRGMTLESERRAAEAAKQTARLAELEKDAARLKQTEAKAAKLAAQLKAAEEAKAKAEAGAKAVQQRMSQRETAGASERDDLRGALEAAEAKVLRLTTEVEELRSARETTEAARTAAEKEAADLTSKLKDSEAKAGSIETLRAELAEARRDGERKDAEIASLKARAAAPTQAAAVPAPKPAARAPAPKPPAAAPTPRQPAAQPGKPDGSKTADANGDNSLAAIFKAVEEVSKEQTATAGTGGLAATATGGAVAPTYTDPPLHLCDRLAADPNDPSRKTAGVVFERMAASEAISACTPAVSSFPDAPRLQYQLGRALERSGSYGDAIARYRLAAERSYGAAQNALGRLYESGRGVRPDAVEAFLWYSLAAKGGNAEARRSLAAMQLTSAQRATAERRIAEWQPRR